MSSDVDRLLVELDELWRPVVTGVRATVNQLKSWTGEYPGSTDGGGSGSVVVLDDEDDGEVVEGRVVFTKVESSAQFPDPATQKLRVLFREVDRMVAGVLALPSSAGVPAPALRLESRVAFVQWQINVLRTSPGLRAMLQRSELLALVRRADHVSRIVKVNAPARKPSGVPAGGCSAHARAGEWAPVDDRFKSHDLCRRCGEFRAQFGQLPPPKLVRWAEKHGWRSALAPSTLDRFAVKRRPARRNA